jgi:glycosyltransferase involved in cell wall biosynthesis
MADVTAIIPAFDRATTLPRAIASVVSQAGPTVEVIVVDDGSRDDTVTVVEALPYTNVRLVRHETNRGPSAARNSGVRAATAAFVAFLDSDDVWLPTKLERQFRLLSENPSLDLVYCGWEWIAERTGVLQRQRVPDTHTGFVDGASRFTYNIVPDLLVRRDLVQRIPFDEELRCFENLDWLLRLEDTAAIDYVPAVLVRCMNHRGPRASNNVAAKIAALQTILSRHKGPLSKHPKLLHRLQFSLGQLLARHHPPSLAAIKHLWNAMRSKPNDLRGLAHSAVALSYLATAAVRQYTPSLRQRRGQSVAE